MWLPNASSTRHSLHRVAAPQASTSTVVMQAGSGRAMPVTIMGHVGNCQRNLAVEKTLAELPHPCRFCCLPFPRATLPVHEDYLCPKRYSHPRTYILYILLLFRWGFVFSSFVFSRRPHSIGVVLPLILFIAYKFQGYYEEIMINNGKIIKISSL